MHRINPGNIKDIIDIIYYTVNSSVMLFLLDL